jgi:hypothetical protein
MFKAAILLFFCVGRVCFSSGLYCVFNLSDNLMEITLEPRGYDVYLLTPSDNGGIQSKIKINDPYLRINKNDGIIFETVCNYTCPGIAQIRIAKGGWIPLTVDFKNDELYVPHFFVSQGGPTNSFLSKFGQSGVEKLKDYSSKVQSVLVFRENK